MQAPYKTTVYLGMKRVFSSMAAEMSLNEKMHVVSFLHQMNEYHTRKISKS